MKDEDLVAEIQKVAFCPHCGNRAPQRLLLQHRYDYPDELTFHEDGNVYSEESSGSVYFVAACCTCNEILVYNHYVHRVRAEDFTWAELVYPKGIELDRSVPETVRTCYAEAARIQKSAPNAYAVMIRRALEAVCEDRGVKNGRLQAKLAQLAERGEIPTPLVEMTSILRALGNAGAHSSDQPVGSFFAGMIDDFFRAIIEYIYIAPSRLEIVRGKLAAMKHPTTQGRRVLE